MAVFLLTGAVSFNNLPSRIDSNTIERFNLRKAASADIRVIEQ